MNLGFELTPLLGEIEQIKFNYKIGGRQKREECDCASTQPFSTPAIRYWKASIFDRDFFAEQTPESFARDYDLYIEITDIRKDGQNINLKDLPIPEVVTKCLERETWSSKKEENLSLLYSYPSFIPYRLELTSKDDLIKEIIYEDYCSEDKYIEKKANDIKEKRDSLCDDFWHRYEYRKYLNSYFDRNKK